jgi:hypothetical protein
MPEIRENSDDLICMSECGNKRTDGFATFEVIEKLELVENSRWAAGDINLLNRNISGSPSLLRVVVHIRQCLHACPRLLQGR